MSRLGAQDLACVSMTCRVLAEHGNDDRLWAVLVNLHLPFPIQYPDPFVSFRRLYLAHIPFWFIPQYKLWFADNEHTGTLVLARYDSRRGVIEAYRLLSERRTPPVLQFWATNPDVMIQTFEPKVRLWLDDPVLLLKDPNPYNPAPLVQSWKEERRMPMPAESQHVFSSIVVCSKKELEDDNAAARTVWPPRSIPSSSRITRKPRRQTVEQPVCLREMLDMVFRLRRWANFRLLIAPSNNETSVTYATLDPSLYTPTSKKRYQGIWVGDYSAHGCEFLLFVQEDLPANSGETQGSSNQDDQGDNAAGGVIQQGRLTAIKLTGDPNVPRGESSFYAEDIGHGGLVRVANEEPFEGARIVRSCGHVAGLGFRDGKFHFIPWDWFLADHQVLDMHSTDSFTDSQLILISPDCVAHYWKEMGHVSYFRRVNIDALLQS